MKLFDYQCPKCGKVFEKEEGEYCCPDCKYCHLEKMISKPHIIFKGKGFTKSK